MTDPVEEILTLYRRKGELAYGEGVSMNAHALQAALLAEQESAGDAPVTAGPLPHIRPFLHDPPGDVGEAGNHNQHQALAPPRLSQYLPARPPQPAPPP